MTSGSQTRDGQFIVVGWGFHGIHVNSRVFFLPLECSFQLPGILDAEVTVPEMILREVASRSGFTWWLSLPMWGSMWLG
jgi:hypothetical protein